MVLPALAPPPAPTIPWWRLLSAARAQDLVELTATEYRIADNAFHALSGVIPASPVAEDADRLRMVDAAIWRLMAAERLRYRGRSALTPHEVEDAHRELLHRIHPAARPAHHASSGSPRRARGGRRATARSGRRARR